MGRTAEFAAPQVIRSWGSGPRLDDTRIDPFGRALSVSMSEAQLSAEQAGDRRGANEAHALLRLEGRYLGVAHQYLISREVQDQRTAGDLYDRSLQPIYRALASRINAATAEASVRTRGDLIRLGNLRTALLADAALAVPVGAGLLWLLVTAFGAEGRQREAELVQQIQQLRTDAGTDPVSGLPNHRLFGAELEREVSRARRQRHTVALAIIDVDDFRGLNEVQGYDQGDRILASLAEFMGGRRASDRTFRLHDDQLGLILPYTTAREIYPLMEHLRTEAESRLTDVTVSIGIADLHITLDDATALEQRAQAALAEAKAKGKNVVVALAVTHPRPMNGERSA